MSDAEQEALAGFVEWAAAKNADFSAERAAHRQAFLVWLAERELPGTPRTAVQGGWVSDEP